jgi:hypothetical protein
MTLREVLEIGGEVCASALVTISLAMIIMLYLLATGNLP